MKSELEANQNEKKKKKESKKYAMKVKKTKLRGGGENIGIKNPNKSDT